MHKPILSNTSKFILYKTRVRKENVYNHCSNSFQWHNISAFQITTNEIVEYIRLFCYRLVCEGIFSMGAASFERFGFSTQSRSLCQSMLRTAFRRARNRLGFLCPTARHMRQRNIKDSYIYVHFFAEVERWWMQLVVVLLFRNGWRNIQEVNRLLSQKGRNML